LRILLAPVAIELPELGRIEALAETTVFDFAAVSIALRIAFRTPVAQLTQLAGWLADPHPLVQASQSAVETLYRQLLPAIQNPQWRDDLSEEYFFFEVPPNDPTPSPTGFLRTDAAWLAGLVRLEAGPLSAEEIAEALRTHLSYSPNDLFVADWAAAVLLDRDCDETLQVIEFANLQLLEFRH